MYTAQNGYEDVQKCIIACPRIKHRGNNRKKAPLNLVSLQKKKNKTRRAKCLAGGGGGARCNRSFFAVLSHKTYLTAATNVKGRL